MSTRWKRFHGDTSRFAIEIEFQTDPDEGSRKDPDVASSWGALRLWAGGTNLTAYTTEGASQDSVHWYLLPLLEWLAANWDALLHEERLPVKVKGADAASSLSESAQPPPGIGDEAACRWEAAWEAWWRRHALLSCREGGLFPNLFIRRFRDQTELSWQQERPPGSPEGLRFSAGTAFFRLPVGEVAPHLYRLLQEASRFLAQQCEGASRLAALVQRVEALRDSQAEGARLAWMAGLGTTFEAMAARWEHVAAAFRQYAASALSAVAELIEAPHRESLYVDGTCHATLLFGSVAPDIKEPDLLRLARAMTAAYAPGQHFALDEHPFDQPLSAGRRPFDLGNALAAAFAERLGLEEGTVPDVEALLARLGVQVGEIELTDPLVRGVSFAGPGVRPTVLLNTADTLYKRRQRFTLAHELCHLLVDRARGARLALASGPWAPLDVEQRANAFAAALLMPETAIARAVLPESIQYDKADWVVRLATEFDVSAQAMLARLKNLDYLDAYEFDHLSEQLGSG